MSVDCDSQDAVPVTPFDSNLLCAATGVQTVFIIAECTTFLLNLAEHFKTL